MTTVASVLSRARRQLHDATEARWTDGDLLDYLNEGQRQIVILLPEANTILFEHPLSPGAKQQIPDTYHALIDVQCNIVSGEEGRTVSEVMRTELDAADPNWRTGTRTDTVEHFARIEHAPRDFVVYPPCTGSSTLLVAASQVPNTVGTADVLSLPRAFESALLHFVCYRCLEEDRESEPSAALASYHEAQFMKMLGMPIGKEGA